MTTLEKILQKITFDKIVGQTLMGYVDEIKSFQELEKMVLENGLGGLIIGRKALSGLKNPSLLLKELATSYRKTLGFSPILAAEHEGKGFEGLSPPATELPSQMGVGATGEAKSAYITGYVTALELRTLSINTNLAPVANLYSTEMGENCFGDDPEEVSSYVASYIRGLRNGGVLSFVKYFPRRFSEGRDEQDLSKLFKHDFKPFQLAFKSGVEGVIIGHSPLPAADSNIPSSLSPKVVERIVKREMGFKNLLMTDYLDDKQVSDKLGPDEAAIRALKAGNHIVVPSRRIEKTQDVLNAILEKTREDKELYDKVKSSALEILSFKLRRLEKFKKTPEKTRGSVINRVKAWKIFTRSLTVAKGVDELPLRWLGKPLVVIARRLRERLEEADGRRLEEILSEELGGFAFIEYVEEMSGKKMSEIYRSTPSNTLLIILSYNTHGSRREAYVLKKLAEFFRESVVVSLGSPEDLTLLSDAKICAAVFTPSLTAVKAALKVLKGKSKPSGKMPIKIEL
ncbi:MAG: glycoside hydrolase family 3 N-terminal domain-containing protein [Thermoproteota archaeon]